MTRILAASAIALICAPAAQAHQLDEYLQATRIGIEQHRIVVEISLTPGTRLAQEIFSTLDRNGDREISTAEIQAYARLVLKDLVLEFDGQPYPLALGRAESPSWPEIRDGIGTIRLEASAQPPMDARGYHQLRFMNNHRVDIGVYLVNPLVPATKAISIREQRRDVHQRGIRIELDVAGSYTAAWQGVFAATAMVGLVAYRRRNRSRSG